VIQWVIAAVYLLPVAGLTIVGHRLSHGRWPAVPTRLAGPEDRELLRRSDDRIRDATRSWCAELREDLTQPRWLVERVATVLFATALFVRSTIHTVVWLVISVDEPTVDDGVRLRPVWLVICDDEPGVDDGVRLRPVQWPTVGHDLVASWLCLAVAGGIWLVAPPLNWGWSALPTQVVRTWLIAQWLVIAGDPVVAIATRLRR